MKFTLAVHGAPFAGQANHHALNFARAAISQGHSINRVFFYHEGVYVALGTNVAPQGEADPTNAWQELAQQQNIELAVCIANGLKRGVISESERDRYETMAATLAEGFELVGLGQLIDAVTTSERYVEFPS